MYGFDDDDDLLRPWSTQVLSISSNIWSNWMHTTHLGYSEVQGKIRRDLSPHGTINFISELILTLIPLIYKNSSDIEWIYSPKGKDLFNDPTEYHFTRLRNAEGLYRNHIWNRKYRNCSGIVFEHTTLPIVDLWLKNVDVQYSVTKLCQQYKKSAV